MTSDQRPAKCKRVKWSQLSELKELRNELSAVKKRIDQLEKSREKQQERIDTLERENYGLKTELLNHLNGNKEDGSVLKRKRTEKDQDREKETEPVTTSVSVCKKTKPNNDKDDDEVAVLPICDNGDSFDSLSDDLLHKIVEFDGNCYSVFGSINKRCKNIYDMKEYKLKKQTCLYGYGTIDMILQHYLQKRKEGMLDEFAREYIADAVIYHNRLDAVDWIIQLGDIEFLNWVCFCAAWEGKIKILSQVFCKCNLTMLDKLLDDSSMCFGAARAGELESLKWLRKYNAKWDAEVFEAARDEGCDEIVQYLRAQGCPEPQDEDTDESSVGSDNEDGDY